MLNILILSAVLGKGGIMYKAVCAHQTHCFPHSMFFHLPNMDEGRFYYFRFSVKILKLTMRMTSELVRKKTLPAEWRDIGYYFSKYTSLVKGIRIMEIPSPFSRSTESSYLELKPWILHLRSFHTPHLPPPENSNTGKLDPGLAEQVWTLNTKCPAFKSSLHPIQAVWPWQSFFRSLSLYFLICKVGLLAFLAL